MTIDNIPQNWKELQTKVGKILTQCGFVVSVEKKVQSIRSQIEIDVYAEESIDDRPYKILIECKMWKSNIPQLYVHGLRTVVSDIGANIGYIITTSDFQKGAIESIKNTNVELITWSEFQKKFFKSWYLNFFSKKLHFDILKNNYDHTSIQLYDDYNKIKKQDFNTLIEKYDLLNLISDHFPHHIMKEFAGQLTDIENKLPLEEKLITEEWEYNLDLLPKELLKVVSYSQFLNLLRTFAQPVYSEMDKLDLDSNLDYG
ncbi:restriction endonuclease [Aureibaculum algae]|uniref:Restriction endonuclease n=1 Tax=Aureibaculum algae TaxID=2584122 RepID=A0A5B7TMY7_9FLAO|nr:restriction endonuclease [Aureibaculum algae]QCX37915.1 restriction endonuclease [Aureibaculum algae]